MGLHLQLEVLGVVDNLGLVTRRGASLLDAAREGRWAAAVDVQRGRQSGIRRGHRRCLGDQPLDVGATDAGPPRRL